jgi:hypothetical protein
MNTAYISDKEDSGNGVMWFKYDGITYGWADDGRLLDDCGAPYQPDDEGVREIIEAFKEETS